MNMLCHVVIKIGETAEETLIRELVEETGLYLISEIPEE